MAGGSFIATPSVHEDELAAIFLLYELLIGRRRMQRRRQDGPSTPLMTLLLTGTLPVFKAGRAALSCTEPEWHVPVQEQKLLHSDRLQSRHCRKQCLISQFVG